jgi:hypothetical protein
MKRSARQIEPEQFGEQPDGTFLPSPDEIQAHCESIRAGESSIVSKRRAPHLWQEPSEVPIVSSELFGSL